MAKEDGFVQTLTSSFPVYIDSNLDTHLAMLVSDRDTIGDLKKKIVLEHNLCFPDLSDITIHALKIRRRAFFYHLSDSMLVKSAFAGRKGTCFLHLEATSSCSIETLDRSAKKHSIVIDQHDTPFSGMEPSCRNVPDCVIGNAQDSIKGTMLSVEQVNPKLTGASSKVLPLLDDDHGLDETSKMMSTNSYQEIGNSSDEIKKLSKQEKSHAVDVLKPIIEQKDSTGGVSKNSVRETNSIDGEQTLREAQKGDSEADNMNEEQTNAEELKSNNTDIFHASDSFLPSKKDKSNKRRQKFPLSADILEKNPVARKKQRKREKEDIVQKPSSGSLITAVSRNVLPKNNEEKGQEVLSLSSLPLVSSIVDQTSENILVQEKKMEKRIDGEGIDITLLNIGSFSKADNLHEEIQLEHEDLNPEGALGKENETIDEILLPIKISSTKKDQSPEKQTNRSSKKIIDADHELDKENPTDPESKDGHESLAASIFDETVQAKEGITDEDRKLGKKRKKQHSSGSKNRINAARVKEFEIILGHCDQNLESDKMDSCLPHNKLSDVAVVKDNKHAPLQNTTNISHKEHFDTFEMSGGEPLVNNRVSQIDDSSQVTAMHGKGRKKQKRVQSAAQIDEKISNSTFIQDPDNCSGYITNSKPDKIMNEVSHEMEKIVLIGGNKSHPEILENINGVTGLECTSNAPLSSVLVDSHKVYNAEVKNTGVIPDLIPDTDVKKSKKSRKKTVSEKGERNLNPTINKDPEKEEIAHTDRKESTMINIKETSASKSQTKNSVDPDSTMLNCGLKCSTVENSSQGVMDDRNLKEKKKRKSRKTESVDPSSNFSSSNLPTNNFGDSTNVESVLGFSSCPRVEPSIVSNHEIGNETILRKKDKSENACLNRSPGLMMVEERSDLSSSVNHSKGGHQFETHVSDAIDQVIRDICVPKNAEKVSGEEFQMNKKFSNINVDSIGTLPKSGSILNSSEGQLSQKEHETDNSNQNQGHKLKEKTKRSSRRTKEKPSVSRDKMESKLNRDQGKDGLVVNEVFRGGNGKVFGNSSSLEEATHKTFSKIANDSLIEGKSKVPTSSGINTEWLEPKHDRKEQQKRQSQGNPFRVAIRKVPSKRLGEVLDNMKRQNSLMDTTQIISKENIDDSSNDDQLITNSYDTTRSLSDNSSLSAYLEGESDDNESTPFAFYGGRNKGKAEGDIIQSQSIDKKNMPLDMIFRSSKSYKKAKFTASQSQMEEDSQSQPMDFVLDSQADLTLP